MRYYQETSGEKFITLENFCIARFILFSRGNKDHLAIIDQTRGKLKVLEEGIISNFSRFFGRESRSFATINVGRER